MSFWYFMFVMLILVPLVIVWLGCVIDVIARDDVRVVQKIAWGIAMLVLPFIGCAIYLITRPKEVVAKEQGLYDAAYSTGPNGYGGTTQAGADVLARTNYGSYPTPRN